MRRGKQLHNVRRGTYQRPARCISTKAAHRSNSSATACDKMDYAAFGLPETLQDALSDAVQRGKEKYERDAMDSLSGTETDVHLSETHSYKDVAEQAAVLALVFPEDTYKMVQISYATFLTHYLDDLIDSVRIGPLPEDCLSIAHDLTKADTHEGIPSDMFRCLMNTAPGAPNMIKVLLLSSAARAGTGNTAKEALSELASFVRQSLQEDIRSEFHEFSERAFIVVDSGNLDLFFSVGMETYDRSLATIWSLLTGPAVMNHDKEEEKSIGEIREGVEPSIDEQCRLVIKATHIAASVKHQQPSFHNLVLALQQLIKSMKTLPLPLQETYQEAICLLQQARK